MNAYTIEKDPTFGDEVYRGPKGAAKIVRGSKWNDYKWRIFFFGPNKLVADEHADIKTRKDCRLLAAEYVVKGYCG